MLAIDGNRPQRGKRDAGTADRPLVIHARTRCEKNIGAVSLHQSPAGLAAVLAVGADPALQIGQRHFGGGNMPLLDEDLPIEL